MDNKIKHLELIQDIIRRMSSNSFKLKGWAVTLISGIFVLAAKDTEKIFFFIAYLPIIMFWGLDSFYLLQEKGYRALYDKVRELPESRVDYSMDISNKESKNDNNSYLKCFFSTTELWFYFPLIVVSTVILIISLCK